MSKGSEFLPEVLGLIEKRLGEIDENIQAVRQDINSMNEYYWDNYTEMDQYGYEDYDNQQALKMQVNANQENWKMRRRLKRMLDAPFFGSVEFVYDGEDRAGRFYIGIGNFARERGALPLIYDLESPGEQACFMTTTKARRPTKRRVGAWTEKFCPNGSTKSVAAR